MGFRFVPPGAQHLGISAREKIGMDTPRVEKNGGRRSLSGAQPVPPASTNAAVARLTKTGETERGEKDGREGGRKEGKEGNKEKQGEKDRCHMHCVVFCAVLYCTHSQLVHTGTNTTHSPATITTRARNGSHFTTAFLAHVDSTWARREQTMGRTDGRAAARTERRGERDGMGWDAMAPVYVRALCKDPRPRTAAGEHAVPRRVVLQALTRPHERKGGGRMSCGNMPQREE